jgi:transposase
MHASPVLKILVQDLENLNSEVLAMDVEMSGKSKTSQYARIIDTIPGIGKYGSLAIASEIGDVGRFSGEDNVFSYAGLVPRIYQSGSREYRGRITKGKTFLKYFLVECVQIHLVNDPDSSIAEAFKRIKTRSGSNKAKIAAARHLLGMIYYMLKRNMTYV